MLTCMNSSHCTQTRTYKSYRRYGPKVNTVTVLQYAERHAHTEVLLLEMEDESRLLLDYRAVSGGW